ncbi:unnamed protein product [Somion occarium]|uniref:Zf-C3HC-domain-containing protein n=1 Tax=Somion occarium TaxID=3059160 RepID=A0ABP1EB84_9APHY
MSTNVTSIVPDDVLNGQSTPILPVPSQNSIKRKYEDAILGLDEAVGDTHGAMLPPSKKFKTARSLYSTLAKYGIRKEPKPKHIESNAEKLETLSKTAPHLAAILSRTATRTRKALPFKFGRQPSPSAALSSPTSAEYRPSSTTSFLSRLATFKLSTYANKPPAIDAVAAAKRGWINDGKDRLVCGICNSPWVVAGKEGMSRDAANALVEKQRTSLVEMHKDGCPWKSKQCDDSIYRVPLQAPSVMAREVKTRAVKLNPVMKDVQIKHPLTSAQVQSLASAIAIVKLPELSPPTEKTSSASIGEAAPSDVFTQTEPSEIALLTALFGWDILPPAPPTPRPRTPSISRAASVAPTSISAGLRSSRDSVSAGPGARSATPVAASRPMFLSHRVDSLTGGLSASSQPKPETTLLHCSLCQRRVGLWAFLPSAQPNVQPDSTSGASAQPRRQLDILKEHRSYCPYVVRSTIVPSLPVPSNVTHPTDRASPTVLSTSSSPNVSGQPGAVEGWRAVWTVITRYGALQRQRLGLSRRKTDRGTQAEPQPSEDVEMGEDEVQAMVTGVKKHGGRDLLRYVKGLLA